MSRLCNQGYTSKNQNQPATLTIKPIIGFNIVPGSIYEMLLFYLHNSAFIGYLCIIYTSTLPLYIPYLPFKFSKGITYHSIRKPTYKIPNQNVLTPN
jgi:hypothetical protein